MKKTDSTKEEFFKKFSETDYRDSPPIERIEARTEEVWQWIEAKLQEAERDNLEYEIGLLEDIEDMEETWNKESRLKFIKETIRGLKRLLLKETENE